MYKQIKIDIKDEFIEEFLDKLEEFVEQECQTKDCIKIFGLTVEEYKKVYYEEIKNERIN